MTADPHDDRDDDGPDSRCDQEEQCLGDPAQDDSRAGTVPFGEGYLDSLRGVGDAALNEEVLDAAVPLEGRWPDPRVLHQDRWWWMRDGERLDVEAFDPADTAWLLRWLAELAADLHAGAVRDETLLTSTGLDRALASLGVPLTADLDPAVWLESTLLVRALRRRAAGAVGG